MAELKLPKNDAPTIFNKEMVIGLLFAPTLLGYGAIVGGLIGGWVGKERMDREKREGKTVSDKPSFWNKDTMLGSLIGMTLGGVAAVSAAAALIAPTVTATSAAATSIVTIAIAPATMALVVIAAGVIGGAAIGAYFGGKHGQKTELAEFAQAQQLQQQQEKAHTREPEREPSIEQEKSPAYAAKIEQERAEAAACHHKR